MRKPTHSAPHISRAARQPPARGEPGGAGARARRPSPWCSVTAACDGLSTRLPSRSAARGRPRPARTRAGRGCTRAPAARGAASGGRDGRRERGGRGRQTKGGGNRQGGASEARGCAACVRHSLRGWGGEGWGLASQPCGGSEGERQGGMVRPEPPPRGCWPRRAPWRRGWCAAACPASSSSPCAARSRPRRRRAAAAGAAACQPCAAAPTCRRRAPARAGRAAVERRVGGGCASGRGEGGFREASRNVPERRGAERAAGAARARAARARTWQRSRARQSRSLPRSAGGGSLSCGTDSPVSMASLSTAVPCRRSKSAQSAPPSSEAPLWRGGRRGGAQGTRRGGGGRGRGVETRGRRAEEAGGCGGGRSASSSAVRRPSAWQRMGAALSSMAARRGSAAAWQRVGAAAWQRGASRTQRRPAPRASRRPNRPARARKR